MPKDDTRLEGRGQPGSAACKPSKEMLKATLKWLDGVEGPEKNVLMEQTHVALRRSQANTRDRKPDHAQKQEAWRKRSAE